MVDISDLVFIDNDLNRKEITKSLQTAQQVLKEDRKDRYIHLHEDLIEANAMVENIVSKLEFSPLASQDMEVVGTALLDLHLEIMLSIQQLTCLISGVVGHDCNYTYAESMKYVNSTETRILRFMRLLIETTPLREIQTDNMTVACIQAEEREIAEMVSRYSSHLKVISGSHNDTTQQQTEAILYVLSYGINLYGFISNHDQVVTGTTLSFVQDDHGNFIQPFDEDDEIIMNINYQQQALSSSMWTDITDAENNHNKFVLNVSKVNEKDFGILLIRLRSAMDCSVNVTQSDNNGTVEDTVVRAVSSRYNPQLTTIIGKRNVMVWVQDSVLGMSFGPVETQTDWLMVPSNVSVSCKECLQEADVLLVVEYHAATSDNTVDEDLVLMERYVTQHVFKGRNNAFGFVLVANDTWTEAIPLNNVGHLTTKMIGDIFEDIDHPVGNDTEDSSTIIDRITTYFQQYSGISRQKVAVLFIDGYEPNCATEANQGECDRLQKLKSNLQTAYDFGIEFITMQSRSSSSVSTSVLNTIARDSRLFFKASIFEDFDLKSSGNVRRLSDDIYRFHCFGGPEWDYNTYFYNIISTLMYNQTNNKWQKMDDIKMKTVNQDTIKFKTNFLGTFGSSMLSTYPEQIDLDEIMDNFINEIENSPYVLAVNIVLIVLTVLLIAVLRRFDAKDKIMWEYHPLLDNPSEAVNAFFLSFYTGLWSSRSLSSAVYIVLKGTKGETTPRKIYEGYRKKNFSRLTLSNFLLTSSRDIGILEEIKIWHDNFGVSRTWYLEKILIASEDKKYTFLCDQWLSPDKGDGRHYRVLYPEDRGHDDGSFLFGHISKLRFFDDFIWLSLLSRPSYSRFTRVQRLVSIMSMLQLSMLCSAMWFTSSSDNDMISSINMGPIQFSYRTLFIGVASAVITVPPMFIVTSMFRRRRLKEDSKVQCNKLNDTSCLPWWSVLVAYGMAASAYITGAFVTFLYSLQWGGEKSSQWLTAFILGTSGGVFIGEPCQVIFMSTILVCLCRKFAWSEIQEMAPLHSQWSSVPLPIDKGAPSKPTKAFIKFETPPAWPGNIDDADRKADSAFNSTAMDRKLITVSKNIFLYTMYILLVAVICGHNAITQSYDQSNMMRKYLTPVREIYSSEDMWNWLINNYTNMMYPKRYPNLASRLLEGRHYMFDDVSYRIGLSRIRQKRVKGACGIPSLMQSVIERCNSLYTSDVEDNSNYCPGWKEFLQSCKGKGFDFTETISTLIFPLWGLFGFYDSSGYIKLLDPRDSDVRNELFHLKQKNWIDEKTRLVIVETVIFNINSKLFTFIQLYFEYASMGGVYFNTRVETMRLYPYIDSFDFLVLGLQIIFVLVTLTRMFHLPFELWKKKKTCCRSVETWIQVLSVCTSISAAVIFTVRVIETISAVEELVNHPDKFVSFQTAADLDVMFKFCISVEMFIAMLKLLKPLTFSYYLYVMRTSIVTSGTELASFSFMIMVIMTAYAIAFTINIGPYNSEFKSIGSAYFALFQILLSHLSYNEVFEKDIEMLVGKLLFGLFVIMMGIFIINIFIAILTDAFNRVQKSMEGKTNCIQTLYVPPFDEELNRYFWMKVDGHLNFVRNILSSSKSWYPNKPPEETKITDENRVIDNAVKLDNIVYKICDLVLKEKRKDEEFTRTCHQFRDDVNGSPGARRPPSHLRTEL